MIVSIEEAAGIVRQGGIIAYPTEAVFGLGCDPENEAVVTRLRRLKERPQHQGFILIAYDFEQLAGYCAQIPDDRMQTIQAGWPGPYTWVFPKSASCPTWLSGGQHTVAVRVTAHPIAAGLCRSVGKALVSTSANRHNAEPARTPEQIETVLAQGLKGVVAGTTGGDRKPTVIRDAVTGAVIRA